MLWITNNKLMEFRLYVSGDIIMCSHWICDNGNVYGGVRMELGKHSGDPTSGAPCYMELQMNQPTYGTAGTLISVLMLAHLMMQVLFIYIMEFW